MGSLLEFFSMGGYGAYVWSAYAITLVVLLANLLVTRAQLSNAKQKIVRRKQQSKKS